jgi:endonuclease YncB( thermonuclease family)
MFRLLVPLLFLLVGCEQAASDLLLGRVIGIADGDTFTMLLAESRTVRIRLDQVDAPERAQAWSRQSQEMLARLLRAGPVRVRVEDTDRYGRSVGRVYAGAVDVNLTMVEQGGAWAYPQYVRDRAFVRAEARARQAKRGLWSMPERETVAPWEFRRTRSARARPVRVPPTPRAEAVEEFACRAKAQCSQMTSCAEANQYLRICGLNRLDRDGDGTPCESLCRPSLLEANLDTNRVDAAAAEASR